MAVKFKTAATALCLAMSVNASAKGEFYNGNDLETWADAYDRSMVTRTSVKDRLNVGMLLGFIAGSVSGPQNHAVGYCLPVRGTLGQLQSVVSNYVRTHPQDLHYTAGEIVWLALIQAFPCK